MIRLLCCYGCCNRGVWLVTLIAGIYSNMVLCIYECCLYAFVIPSSFPFILYIILLSEAHVMGSVAHFAYKSQDCKPRFLSFSCLLVHHWH